MSDENLEFNYYSGCIEDLNECLRKYSSYIDNEDKRELRHAIKSAAESFALAILFFLDSSEINVITTKGDTISFNESIKLLEKQLQTKIEHAEQMKDLKKIRNNFVHQGDSIKTQLIVNLLDKFMYSMMQVFKDFDLDLHEIVDEDCRLFLLKRSEYYKKIIEERQLFIDKDNYFEIGVASIDCPHCGEVDSYVLTSNEEYWCVFCNIIEIAARCDDCHDIYPESELGTFEFEEDERYCPSCLNYHESRINKF